jgi:hypothetical protein
MHTGCAQVFRGQNFARRGKPQNAVFAFFGYSREGNSEVRRGFSRVIIARAGLFYPGSSMGISLVIRFILVVFVALEPVSGGGLIQWPGNGCRLFHCCGLVVGAGCSGCAWLGPDGPLLCPDRRCVIGTRIAVAPVVVSSAVVTGIVVAGVACAGSRICRMITGGCIAGWCGGGGTIAGWCAVDRCSINRCGVCWRTVGITGVPWVPCVVGVARVAGVAANGCRCSRDGV